MEVFRHTQTRPPCGQRSKGYHRYARKEGCGQIGKRDPSGGNHCAQACQGTPSWRLWTLLTFLMVSVSVDAADARTDPETGRIRVIFIVEVKTYDFPYPGWIRSEPKFTLQTVPCDIQHFSPTDAARYVRLYLPRTYEDLVGSYDAMILEDFAPTVLPGQTLQQFKQAVGNEGLGILLVEYVYWPENLNRIEQWVESELYELFPASPIVGKASNVGHSYYRVVGRSPILNLPRSKTGPWMEQATETLWPGKAQRSMPSGRAGRPRPLSRGPTERERRSRFPMGGTTYARTRS